jgi:hypothetical protein
VLVQEKPSVEFLSGIKQAGFPLPEFVEPPARRATRRANSAGCARGHGAGQRGIVRAAFCQLTGGKAPLGTKFQSGHYAALFQGLERRVVENFSCADAQSSPVACVPKKWSERRRAFSGGGAGGNRDDPARGHHKIVIKEALGLAGGNALRLFEPELETHRRWLECPGWRPTGGRRAVAGTRGGFFRSIGNDRR